MNPDDTASRQGPPAATGGTVTETPGTTTDGSAATPAGSATTPAGSAATPDDTATTPAGSAATPDDTATTPDGPATTRDDSAPEQSAPEQPTRERKDRPAWARAPRIRPRRDAEQAPAAPRMRTGVGPGAREYLHEDDLPELPEPIPAGGWHPDLLGQGFEALTLPLPDDDEGEVVATLVAHRPGEDPLALPGTPSTPTWAMLYLHGWNDYVHNPEVARQVAALGGAFYGLDLRKYGRSLRPHQSRGYTESFSVYDADIHAARDVIHDELGHGTDLVLMGHSTGGLTAALWAHRHPGALRGLVLTSPFISSGLPSFVGAMTTPVLEGLARTSPRSVVRVSPVDVYQRTLDGLAEGDDETPPAGEEDDPFWRGWKPERRWRVAPAGRIRVGWLAAVTAGQRQVHRGLQISCPVLLLTSARSTVAVRWDPDLRFVDTVLDVDAMRQAALNLGPHVTLAAVEGAIHDVTLSAPSVRRDVYDELGRWVRGYVLR